MENEINLKAGRISLNLHPGEFSLPADLLRLTEHTLEILDARLEELLGFGLNEAEVNLNILSDHEIREINSEHRHKDKATDVLSFPLNENPRRGDYEMFEGRLELGDILIADGVCAAQASSNGLSFSQEFVHLFAHGFLHLCGYDHEENEEEDRLMRGLEDEIMAELEERKGGS